MIQFVQILFPSKWGGTKVRNGNFDLFIIFSTLRASLSSALPLSLQLVLQLVDPEVGVVTEIRSEVQMLLSSTNLIFLRQHLSL